MMPVSQTIHSRMVGILIEDELEERGLKEEVVASRRHSILPEPQSGEPVLQQITTVHT